MKSKYQVRYTFKDDPTVYCTYYFAPLEDAERKANYANRYFRRNGARHFLGPADEYIKP